MRSNALFVIMKLRYFKGGEKMRKYLAKLAAIGAVCYAIGGIQIAIAAIFSCIIPACVCWFIDAHPSNGMF